ncbi:tRNA preQ1(34) S-adenosylmethionine ribosyltransferase-isomerase QueA [bacterium]|nr:tRNA preQ1(34) S-adenosylmethionine ribosyltransferase-isomerase QueA [bacterium]
MKLSHFSYELPTELIAQHPTINRDDSRLLVLHRDSGKIEHRMFHEVLDYFNEGDVMILNDSLVFPARMYGNKEKTGAVIEVFLLRELNMESRLWDVLVDPARKIRIGNKLYFGEDDELVAEVIDNTTSRGRTLRFLFDGSYEAFRQKLKDLGETPIPKYITRPVEPEDAVRYQSIFAKHEGAVAAPVASLHFSKQLVKRMEIKGINFAMITMHVGLGTFKQVEVEDLSKHKMDSEQFWITRANADIINKSITGKKQVCAVGTTVVRALESSVSTTKTVNPYDGWTSRFIFPPYEFQIPTSIITNFQEPQSTLLMLKAAFCGHELIMHAYHEAIKEKYRFLAYGDAMLIL